MEEITLNNRDNILFEVIYGENRYGYGLKNGQNPVILKILQLSKILTLTSTRE